MFPTMMMTPWRERFAPSQAVRAKEHPLDVFYRDFDRLFQTLWRDFDLPMLGTYETPYRTEPYWAATPKMDVSEDAEGFHITLELPGMTEKDVEVQLKDKVLVITGEKTMPKAETGKPYGYPYSTWERSYGSFRRSIPLDAEVVTDKITAIFDKGVLSIEVPKTPEAKAVFKKIPVRAAGAVQSFEKAA